MQHHGHAHQGHTHGHGTLSGAPRRALATALGITASFMVVELVVGLWAGSLALVADAGHMLNDSGALALSLFVTWIAFRPRTAKHTYGYRRAEVMGAFINSVTLTVAGIWIIIEAIERLGAPREVQGVGMLGTACVGLLVNLASAWILARRGGDSINVRAALFHVLGDALGSVAAIVAGGFILALGWHLADPIASLIIAVLIIGGALRLLRDATNVLMEGVPAGLDIAELEATIRETAGVAEVHDLHVWALVPDMPVLSAHVVLKRGTHGTDVVRHVGERLRERHRIGHTTIQPESPEPPLVKLGAER